jgi:hypothetical protein
MKRLISSFAVVIATLAAVLVAAAPAGAAEIK